MPAWRSRLRIRPEMFTKSGGATGASIAIVGSVDLDIIDVGAIIGVGDTVITGVFHASGFTLGFRNAVIRSEPTSIDGGRQRYGDGESAGRPILQCDLSAVSANNGLGNCQSQAMAAGVETA